MDRNSVKFAVMLLAFSVGVAIASIFYFQSKSEQVEVTELTGQYPQDDQMGKTLEMVFVIDTTGSMGGLIEGAKQKIWGIINEVMQKQSRPRVKVGLVAYRDRGDAYVTKVTPLTGDLDKVYMELMDYAAEGGGDTPEAVANGLSDGVTKAGWTRSRPGLAQIIFLVGDAPPQTGHNAPDVLTITAAATRNNMIVNTIQCGNLPGTQTVWQDIARSGQGRYFAIAQDGGVENVNTPYDEKLSELGTTIGTTYMAYGDAPRQGALQRELAVTDSRMAANAAPAAKADRSINKALNQSAYNDDLLQDIENGKIDLSRVKEDELPSGLRGIPADQRPAEVEKRLAERKKIRDEILTLSKQREAYISTERNKSGKPSGFDAAVSDALSQQLAGKGIE